MIFSRREGNNVHFYSYQCLSYFFFLISPTNQKPASPPTHLVHLRVNANMDLWLLSYPWAFSLLLTPAIGSISCKSSITTTVIWALCVYTVRIVITVGCTGFTFVNVCVIKKQQIVYHTVRNSWMLLQPVHGQSICRWAYQHSVSLYTRYFSMRQAWLLSLLTREKFWVICNGNANIMLELLFYAFFLLISTKCFFFLVKGT